MIDYMICWECGCEKLLFLGPEEDVSKIPPPQRRVCDILFEKAGRSINGLLDVDDEVPQECIHEDRHK